MPKRCARRLQIDFSTLEPGQAEVLLEEYVSDIAITARLFRDHLVDEDDLIAVGRIAVLEGYLNFDESRECRLDVWIRKLIRQRMLEEARRYTEMVADPALVDALQNGKDPGQHYDTVFAKEAIGRLDPREAAVMWLRLRGYRVKEIALQLGVSQKTVWESEKQALQQLSNWALRDPI